MKINLLKTELKKAIELAKKYKISKLYLVGSALHGNPEKANDYDFAIEGYSPKIFFQFYGELFGTMSKNVDLIDLSGQQSLFAKLVKKEAKLIYEQRKS